MIGRIVAAAVMVAAAASPAAAKRFGFSTPSRSIYDTNEEFGDELDQDRRKWVAEVAVGNGPEGNLGLSLGYLLNIPEGFELYGGFGTRTGPVIHYSGAFRYFLPFVSYRAYVGGGYVLQHHPKLDVVSHSAFGEVGYKWIIKHTFHITFSAGVQNILHTAVLEDSVLRGPDVDPASLERELNEINDLRFLAALRLSRAF